MYITKYDSMKTCLVLN